MKINETAIDRAAAVAGMALTDGPHAGELRTRLIEASDTYLLAAQMLRSIAFGMSRPVDPDSVEPDDQEPVKKPGRRKVSDETRQTIVRMLAAGVSLSDVAKQTGVPHGTIHGIRSRIEKTKSAPDDGKPGRPVNGGTGRRRKTED